jgi:lysophospholipase L1-like esterase
LLLALALPVLADEAAEKERQRIEKWGPAIAAFEQQDRSDPPPQQGVLFVGSSTIKLWDTRRSFPNLPTINRGFGGSQLADTLHYLDQLVLKHKPRVVVLHAGGNDLAGGKPAQQAAADLRAIADRLQRELPDTRLVFIGIKPTIARRQLVQKERELNDLVRKDLRNRKTAVFIEVDHPFSDERGEPRADLLRPDKLHLNDAGYRVLTELVRPHVETR